MLQIRAKGESLFDQTSLTLRTVADRSGWDRQDALACAKASYAEVCGIGDFFIQKINGEYATEISAEKQTSESDEAYKARLGVLRGEIGDFFRRKGPDISKIMVLSYPAEIWPKKGKGDDATSLVPYGADDSSSPKKELETVRTHNTQAAKGNYLKVVGINRMLEVARGNLSAAEAISPTPAKPNATLQSPTPTPPATSVTENPEHEPAHLTIEEKFGTSIVAWKLQGLTLDQALRQVHAAFTATATEATKA